MLSGWFDEDGEAFFECSELRHHFGQWRIGDVAEFAKLPGFVGELLEAI